MKRLLLIVNPVAGKGQGKNRLFEMVDIFSKHGYRVSILPTSSDGKTESDIIREIKNYDLAVAVGGDGTLNSVVNGLVKSGFDIPLGYIPLGSANDVGFSLGLDKNIKKACERIATSEANPIDIGRIDDKYFVYIACSGLFTDVSYSTSQKMKNVLGPTAYVLEGVSDLAKPQKTRYTVELDDEILEGNFLYVGISNTLRIAGVFSLDKFNVRFDDGIFELIMVKDQPNSLKNFALWSEILASKFDSDNFIRRKVKKVILKCDAPRSWTLDGESGGERTETVIEVCEKALRLIY